MKRIYSLLNKSINQKKILLLLSLLTIFAFSHQAHAQVTTVNSLTELLPYLDDDNANVKLAPGTYTVTAADIENGTFGTPRFVFSGNNSIYDFTGVTINFAADVYTRGHSMSHIQTLGNYNVLKNLTMVDLCSKYGTQVDGGVNVLMDGSYNRVEGFHMTVRGSYPYGYGDCFGKGGTYTIKHWKHSAFLIRGDYNHALNDTIYHYSYGHCMFMQAANHPTIEGCHLVGETRTTDEMLAEEGTGSAADLIDFYTVWGYRLPSGYTKSTGEAGIRAYNAGSTTVNGVEYERGTNDPTILNCYVKDLRVGVTLTHATGTKYVEGVTAIGTERGFAIGSGDIVDCYADAQHGPVFGIDYESDKNCNAEITVLPYEGETYNGSKYLAYIRGSNHNITFKSEVPNPDQDLKIEFGGNSRTVGQLGQTENYLAKNVTLNNYTNYPVILDDNSNDNTGVSGGMVSDFGTNNNITHTAVSAGKYQAEDYSNASDVTTETTTDEGGGENVSSIESGDFLEYEIEVPYSGTYSIDYRVASVTAGDFTVSLGVDILENITFVATGGVQTWATVSSSTPIVLEEGIQTIKVSANSSEWNFNWFDLILECADVEIAPYIEEYSPIGATVKAIDAFDLEIFPGNSVSLLPKPEMGGTWSWVGPNGFTADTRVIVLSHVDSDDAGEYTATFTNDCGQQTSAIFTISVSGSSTIEAEAFTTQNGVVTETTTDDGAGQNVTSIDAGDWMEYTIDITIPASYTIDYRVASVSSGIDLSLSVDGVILDQPTFAATGGVQLWETRSSAESIYLPEGVHTFRITANSTGWNFNWLKLLAQDYVSPCNLPLVHDGFMVQDETVSWTTGLMDITCVSAVNVYIESSQSGILTASDSLNIYYRLDGGALIEISKNVGSLSETLAIVRELSGTTIEIIIEGASSSTDNYYSIDKISVVEATDPFARIEAEDFESKDAAISSSGTRLGSIEPGGWSMYTGLDLTGAQSIDVSVGTTNSDAYIEVRLDAVDGPLIATVAVPNTGNYNTYRTASIFMEEVTGIYDVYLVYQTITSSSVCNIDWLQFSDAFVKRPTEPYERFEAEINDKQSGTVVTTTSDIDGDEEVGGIQDGDYIMFSAIDIEAAASVDVRVASTLEGGVIEVRVGSNKGDIIAFIDVPITGDTTTWQTVSAAVDFVEGENDIYFVFKGEGNNLVSVNWLKFSKGSNLFPRLEVEDYTTASEAMRAPSSTTDPADNGTGEVILLMKSSYWLHFADVDLTGANSISTRFATAYDDVSVEVRLDAVDGELIATIDMYDTGGFSDWKTVGVNISGVSGVRDVYFVYQTETSSYACNSNWFQFSEFEVAEIIDPLSRIEAEDYTRVSGTVTTTTSDVDGKEQLSSLQDGDWMLYKNVDLTDLTKINVRYRTPSDGCSMIVRLGSYDGKVVGYFLLPNTNSAWETLNAKLLSTTLEGIQDVYLICKGTSDELFDINWFQFQTATSAISDNVMDSEIKLYPNPVSNHLMIADAEGSTVEIYNMLGNLISVTSISSSEQTIDFSNLTEGYYLVKATKADGNIETFKVIKN